MPPKGSVGKVSSQECCSQCGALFEVPMLFSVCVTCVFRNPRNLKPLAIAPVAAAIAAAKATV